MRPLAVVARTLSLGAFLVAAVPASALQPVGHEFRPDAGQRAGTDPCLAGDGTKAAVVFRCDELSPGFCSNPSKGKLYAEWRTSGGELVSEPVLVADGYYSYGPPYSCNADGTILLVLEEGLRVIGPEGIRATVAKICDTGTSCGGPFGVSASDDGFLVAWFDFTRGLLGRFYAADGGSPSPSFLIADSRSGFFAKHGLLLPNGDVLLAWRGPTSEPSIFAVVVEKDGTVQPPVAVNEFGRIELLGAVRLAIEEDDRVLVAWHNGDRQAGWVARRLTTGDTVPTTTTTTLPSDGPAFLPAIELGTSIIGDDTHFTGAPSLVGDDSGRWLAEWRDRVETEDYNVLGTEAARSDRDGFLWSPAEPFHGTDATDTRDTVLAGDGKGVVLDAWSNESETTIWLRRSTDGGQTWGEPTNLYESEHPDEWDWLHEFNGFAIVGNATGSWMAVWGESVWYQGPCTHEDCIDYEEVTVLCEVRSSVSTDSGLTWSAPRTVLGGSCYSDRFRLAGDGSGNWLLAWPESPSIEFYVRGVVSTDDGESWSEPTTLLSDLVRPEHLAVAANPAGGWLMAFEQWHFDLTLEWPDQLYRRMYTSRSDDPDSGWSTPAPLAPWHETLGGNDLFASVAAGGPGEFGISWSSHSSGGGLDADIVAAFSDDGGETWSTPRNVDDAAGHDVRRDLSSRLVRVGGTWAIASLSVDDPKTILFARTRGDCGNGDIDGVESCDDGNDTDGDGCDITCLPTGCGSLIVTSGEDCEDGNTDDTDDCVSCTGAACGDGFVEAGVEECDDANSIDTDECVNACLDARCGDAIERPGIEECDDGTTSGSNDSCLDSCVPAACGDGYLLLGEEECDDGNLADGDGCTAGCMLEGNCVLLNRSGLRVKASDAAKVLRRAVGSNVECPLRDCDVNGDGKVAGIDALTTLRSAVGLLPGGCSWPSKLFVRLASDEKLGALQVKVRYADAAGHVVAKSSGNPSCTRLFPTANTAINGNVAAGEITIGMVSLSGIQGPADLVRCEFDPVSGPSLRDFSVVIQDASDLESHPVTPLPVVTVNLE